MSEPEQQLGNHQLTQASVTLTWRRALEPLAELVRRDRFALAGMIIYALFVVVAIAAPWLAPHNPDDYVTVNNQWVMNAGPGPGHWLGTTNMGKDIFSQLIYGTRSAMLVGFAAAIAVVVIGTVVGLVAGYFGGLVDTLFMRLTDIAFGIPFLPFVIVLVAFLGPNIWNIVLSMAMLLWRDTARIIRAQVLTVRQRAYVQSAVVSGASHLRTIFVHIAPNILPLSFLYGALAMGWAILTQASVSFLGFGDPKVISWGYMLQDAYVSQAMMRGAYYWFIPPGLCIMLAVMAGFFIGRGTEDLLHPELKES